jgi:hypothetical protein
MILSMHFELCQGILKVDSVLFSMAYRAKPTI